MNEIVAHNMTAQIWDEQGGTNKHVKVDREKPRGLNPPQL